jgi:hypothetical protein
MLRRQTRLSALVAGVSFVSGLLLPLAPALAHHETKAGKAQKAAKQATNRLAPVGAEPQDAYVQQGRTRPKDVLCVAGCWDQPPRVVSHVPKPAVVPMAIPAPKDWDQTSSLMWCHADGGCRSSGVFQPSMDSHRAPSVAVYIYPY